MFLSLEVIMNNQQFIQLRYELQGYVVEIVKKLEEIRCGVVDAKTLVQKIHEAHEKAGE